MKIIKDKTFDDPGNVLRNSVFQIIPDVHTDNRGFFCEVMKFDGGNTYVSDGSPTGSTFLDEAMWIRQINRSSSIPGVVRGLHAQRGRFCQAKMVEAINSTIYDVIVDARPDSTTFGTWKFYILDPDKQNKLYIPRGFLHGFIVPNTNQTMSYFNYYCDNLYNHESEITVCPKDPIRKAVSVFRENLEESLMFDNMISTVESGDNVFSEKDSHGVEFESFMSGIQDDWNKNGELWYR